MPFPIEADVRDTLGPYHPRIRSIVERAWEEWRRVSAFRSEAEMGAILYSRSVANYVFDAIARFAIAEFQTDDSVRLKVETQTIKLFFRGNVLGRFKKGDDSKLGQNIPTQAALAYEDCNGTLPGLPAETAKVEFIWLPNEIQTRLEHVLVVARDGDRLLWEYEIDGESGAGSGLVIPFPTPPTSPSPPTGGNEGLVTPKKLADKKTKEKE